MATREEINNAISAAKKLIPMYNLVQQSIRDEIDNLDEEWEKVNWCFIQCVYDNERYKDKEYKLKLEINNLERELEIITTQFYSDLPDTITHNKLCLLTSQFDSVRDELEAHWRKHPKIMTRLYQVQEDLEDKLYHVMSLIQNHSEKTHNQLCELYV